MIKIKYPCKTRKITSPYGPRSHIGDGFHDGTDFACSMKSDINVVALGKVADIGYQKNGYGHYVVVQHEGFYTVYAHLSEIKVKTGQVVKLGDIIALSGNSGNSKGPHLHFEIRFGVYSKETFRKSHGGRYLNSIDPEFFLVEEDWRVKQGQKALSEICAKGLINDTGIWKDRMLDPLPAWLVWEMINRSTKKESP